MRARKDGLGGGGGGGEIQPKNETVELRTIRVKLRHFTAIQNKNSNMESELIAVVRTMKQLQS